MINKKYESPEVVFSKIAAEDVLNGSGNPLEHEILVDGGEVYGD